MENRLTKVSRSDSTVVATFAYDALGRRIETVDAIAGTTTRYYYDDQRVAVQTQVSGGVETDFRYYVFGNYIDEVLVMGFRFSTSWINFYYGHDHLYSPVVMFMPNGTPVERYEYDVYGAVQILTANYEPRTTSVLDNPYTFTGRELDILDAGSLRLMYYRARTYDPETGRFMQRDPLGILPGSFFPNFFDVLMQFDDGMNLYGYIQFNPLQGADPYGLSTKKCHKIAIRHEIDTKKFKLLKPLEKFGLRQFKYVLDISGKRCEVCCIGKGYKKDAKVDVAGKIIAEFGGKEIDLKVAYIKYGLYGRATGGLNAFIGYNPCTEQIEGGGCGTASFEMGLMGEGGVKDNAWIEGSVGARGGFKATAEACVVGSTDGTIEVKGRVCGAGVGRVWANFHMKKFWKTKKTIFYEYSIEGCSDWRKFASFKLN